MMIGRISKQDRRRKPLKDIVYDHETARASFASRRFIDAGPGRLNSRRRKRLVKFTFFAAKSKPFSKNGGRSDKHTFLQRPKRALLLVDLSMTKLEPAKFTEIRFAQAHRTKGKNGSGIRPRTCASVVHRTRCQVKPDAESDINTELQHGLRQISYADKLVIERQQLTVVQRSIHQNMYFLKQYLHPTSTSAGMHSNALDEYTAYKRFKEDSTVPQDDVPQTVRRVTCSLDQKKFEENVVRFILDNMLAFRIVETASFRTIFSERSPRDASTSGGIYKAKYGEHNLKNASPKESKENADDERGLRGASRHRKDNAVDTAKNSDENKSTDKERTMEVDENNEFIELLGDDALEESADGPPILDKLAEKWSKILKLGLPKYVKQALLKKHEIPSNCLTLKAPILNEEGSSSTGSEASPGGRQIIRSAFMNQGFDETSVDIIMSSIQKSTLKQYETAIRHWWDFCKQSRISVFSTDVTIMTRFFNQEKFKDKSLSTLNTYRAALSMLNMNKISKDAGFSRFFKGLSVLRPQKPKYSSTWDPECVVKYLATKYPNEALSLEQLTKKLVMLLALSTAQRVQTLSKISIENITISESCIEIKVPDRIKTSGRNKTQPLLRLRWFTDQPKICTAAALTAYIEKTKNIRGKNGKLFITFKKPHHNATSQTISRWIRNTLEDSGVDVASFGAHSTRHASTSAAARKGINIETIRKTAGWTEKSATFARFYNQPIQLSEDFARAS
ncbi:unnamed protein product [Trichogramma brassicae]|uniref:Tyr recombinase domain-containing protein n=1 Tax=Trichogramma brassicae TaxID=86971 RepID=A0A6H5IZH2_9HYME|nr:unnamed protein product [Trichogramma brassicae]